jgi:predicted RecB family endonuclease
MLRTLLKSRWVGVMHGEAAMAAVRQAQQQYAQQHALRLVLERLVDESSRQLAQAHAHAGEPGATIDARGSS